MGTPAYMAPEVPQGVITPAADMYSLGICFYEMLTGKPPYQMHSVYLKKDRVYKDPSGVVAGTSPEIDRLVRDALDPDPATRIKSAGAFLQRLEAIL